MENGRIAKRQRILFFAEAVTLAHVARPAVLAQALDRNRYEIIFASALRYQALFPVLQSRWETIDCIPSEEFIEKLAKGERLYGKDTLRSYVEQDIDLIDKHKPDLVVGDFRLSLAVSAPATKTPYVTITNAYWSPYANRRFPIPDHFLTRLFGVDFAQIIFNMVRPVIFAYHSLPLNRVRRDFGLEELGYDLCRVYTDADMTLYADAAEMLSVVDLPENHRFIGPISWSPPVELPEWWTELRDEEPIIFLTLGSSGKSDLLPAVMDALSELLVTVIVATAGRIAIRDCPKNAYIADYLPGEKAVQRANLVICNGGSPTAYLALLNAVPVLGIASNMDQHLNMEAIVTMGFGELIRSEKVSRSRICSAVNKLLQTSTYNKSVRSIKQTLSKYNACLNFENAVSSLLGN